MAEQLETGVKIMLDRERTLIFDLAAMKAYQKQTGKSPLKPIDLNDIEQLEALLWACLIRDDPALKFEAIAAMLSIRNVRLIQAALMNALYAVMPEVEDKQALPLAAKSLNGAGGRPGLLGAIASIFKRRNSGG